MQPSIQPDVQTIHDNWRKTNLGSYMDPFEKLTEKLSEYNKGELIVTIQKESPWSVLIVTEIMKRTQQLESSAEMIFCDSSASCDTKQSTVTVLLSATKAGAVPIGILIHESQTSASYVTAFNLLKTTYPKCFGGGEFPALVMTDDGIAEKNALKTVWPHSEQLLCHFHVAQAEWCWLHSNASITKVKKQELMFLFKKVLYAKESNEL